MNIRKNLLLIALSLQSFLTFSQRIHEDIKSVIDLAVTNKQVERYIFNSKLRSDPFAYVMATKEVGKYISNYHQFYDSIATTESKMFSFVRTNSGQLYLIVDPFHSSVVDVANSLNTAVIVVKRFNMDYHSAKLIFRTTSLTPKKDSSFKYIKVICKARWNGSNWEIATIQVKSGSFINLIN